MLTKTVSVKITLTPEELAKAFTEFDEYEQSEFFNEVAILVKQWKQPFEFQMDSVSRCGMLTPGARQIMTTIGEYSKPSNDEATVNGPTNTNTAAD